MTSEPDTAFLARLRERSAQAFAAAEAAGEAPHFWRHLMRQRPLRLAAAAALLAGILLGGLLWQGTNARAYAQVVALLREARTLVYTLVTPASDGSGSEVATTFAFKDPAWLRTTTAGGHITVIDGTQGRQLSLVPETQTYIEGTFEMATFETDPAGSPFATVTRLRALPARAEAVLEEQVLDGHRVRGYRVTDGDATTTVWIDVDSYDLVRVEQVYAGAPGMNYTMRDFQFDAELDASLFDLTPPAGYHRLALEAGAGGSEALFVDFLRLWATEWAVDGTFPPLVLGPQISKVMVDMAQQGKLRGEAMAKLDPNRMYQALLWVAQLPPDSGWRYLGAQVAFGDAEMPIFWYRPPDARTYRVVYADLHVAEVLPEDLPRP